MSKTLKNTISQHLVKRLGGLESYVLVDFRGLNSAQSFELRKVLHDAGIRMNVLPNRMAFKVLDRWGGKREDFRMFFRGPTAILYGNAGAVAASRVAMQWKKKNKDLLAIKGGVLDGQILPPSAAEGLSKIPGRLELLAQVAGGFKAPLARLACATQGILGNLVRALEAHRKRLGEPETNQEGGGGGEIVAAAGGP